MISKDVATLERSLHESWASEKRLAARIAALEAALRGMIAVADGNAGDMPWLKIDEARACLALETK